MISMHGGSNSADLDDVSHVFILRQRRHETTQRQYWQRTALCLCLGIALCAVIGNAVFSRSTQSEMEESGQLETQLSASKQSDLTVNSKEASKRRLAAKARSMHTKEKPLTASERKRVLEKVKKLKAEVKSEQAKASKLDKAVEDKSSALRTELLKAKTFRRDGDDFEDEAKEKVRKAAKERKLAENFRRESEAAKRKFVAEEKPIEMAMKLEAHDERAYRKMQLAIAEHVTLLSEHPDSTSLRKQVQQLVASSKTDKKRLEEDKHILHTLQDRTADASLSGTNGYAALREKSVKVAKEAEQLAEAAVTLAKKGHKDRVAATKIVEKVETGIKSPEALSSEAERQREALKQQLAQLKVLRAQLAVKAPSAEGASAAASSDRKPHDYDQERQELEKEATGHSRRGGGGGRSDRESSSDDNGDEESRRKAHGDERHSGEGQTAAEADYSRMEAEALQREQRKTREERRRREEETDGGSDSSSSELSTDTESSVRRRANIVSDKQSTFLMGLFSNKAPWDTDKDRAR